MAVLLSTNMYLTDRFHEIADYVREFDGQIGVEIFPIFNDPRFEGELEKLVPLFSRIQISFHGPYYTAEHSAPAGTPEYQHTMKLVQDNLPYERLLHSHHFVYHHNNKRVTPEAAPEMIRISRENYRKVEALHRPYRIPVVVENVGIHDRENILFEQEAFTRLCIEENYPVLIDIGHANANGWDIEKLMADLKDRIVAYHLHNNDGIHDSHRRIHDGTIDFEKFIRAWRRNGVMTDWILEYSQDIADDRKGISDDLRYLMEEYHL